MRAGRRANPRVGRHAALRAGRRAVLRAGGRAVLRAGRRAGSARRKTRRLRAGRRAVCTPRARAGDVPVARRVRARARPFLFAGSGRCLGVVVVRPGPGGWLTAPPSRPPGVRGVPPPLAALGRSTQHLSRSRGALSCRAPVLRALLLRSVRATYLESGESRKQKDNQTPPESEGNIKLPFPAETRKVQTRFRKKQIPLEEK